MTSRRRSGDVNIYPYTTDHSQSPLDYGDLVGEGQGHICRKVSPCFHSKEWLLESLMRTLQSRDRSLSRPRQTCQLTRAYTPSTQSPVPEQNKVCVAHPDVAKVYLPTKDEYLVTVEQSVTVRHCCLPPTPFALYIKFYQYYHSIQIAHCTIATYTEIQSVKVSQSEPTWNGSCIHGLRSPTCLGSRRVCRCSVLYFTLPHWMVYISNLSGKDC